MTLFGMSLLELFAATLGLVSVWLTVRQNVWAWPIGAVMVALYAVIFYRVRLYADAGLQVVYFVLQFYGWYEWLYGGRGRTELRVTRTPPHVLPWLFALGAAGTATLGFLLNRFTDQHLSYWDSGITTFSLIAQWMLARKRLENWLVWIGVDVVAVGVYAYKELYPTAVLYAVFCAMAAAGYVAWRRAERSDTEQPPRGFEPVLKEA